MNARTRRLLMAGSMAAATLLLPACQQKGNHEQWVDDANNRYTNMRSALMIDMARQQFDTGDLDLAEKTVKDAMALDADNASLHVLAGRIALERGRLERAYHFFNTAMQFDDRSAEARYYQGLVMQRWQRLDDAELRYREAYDREPDNVSYLLALAEMMVERDHDEQALELLESKIDYFDQNAAVRLAVAHLHVMNGRPDLAVPFFEQAAMLDPEGMKVREDLALAQLAAGHTEAAIETLEDMGRRTTDQPRYGVKRTLAAAYMEVGRQDKARSLYLEVARSPRGKASDWIKLGELSLKSGDLFGTLTAANRAIELAPKQHEGYMLAGIVWQKRNDLDKALRMFDQAAELAPTHAAPLILRGISLERAGRRAAAAEAYQDALHRQPNDQRAEKLLSNLQ